MSPNAATPLSVLTPNRLGLPRRTHRFRQNRRRSPNSDVDVRRKTPEFSLQWLPDALFELAPIFHRLPERRTCIFNRGLYHQFVLKGCQVAPTPPAWRNVGVDRRASSNFCFCAGYGRDSLVTVIPSQWILSCVLMTGASTSEKPLLLRSYQLLWGTSLCLLLRPEYP